MVKIAKTWDTTLCIKNMKLGTMYFCPCSKCMEERLENARKMSQEIEARNNRLKTQVRQFWTDDYNRDDKAHARRLLRAGYDDPNYRAGVFIDEQINNPEERGDDYNSPF